MIETLHGVAWSAGVARSDDAGRRHGARGCWRCTGDVTDTESVTSARGGGRSNGPLDLVVNAAAAYGGTRSGTVRRRTARRGGAGAFDLGLGAALRRSRSCRPRPLPARPRPSGRRHGGHRRISSRRAMPAAGSGPPVRSGSGRVTQAAALYLRDQAPTSPCYRRRRDPPLTARAQGVDPATLADPYAIGHAAFLAEQGRGRDPRTESRRSASATCPSHPRRRPRQVLDLRAGGSRAATRCARGFMPALLAWVEREVMRPPARRHRRSRASSDAAWL